MTTIVLKLAPFVMALVVFCGCKPTAAEQKHEAVVAKESRLKWNQRTLVEAYKQAGHTDAKWDEAAKGALDEFARVRAGEVDSIAEANEMISNECVTAVGQGCDDALLRYLSVRYCRDNSQPRQQVADAFCDAATRLEGTGYPAIRKYYAWWWAAKQVTSGYGYGTNIPPRIDGLDIWSHAETDLQQALDDKTMPLQEAVDASGELLEMWSNHPKHFTNLFNSIEAKLGDRWSKSPAILLIEGNAYVDIAWAARGSGYANSVTDEGWKVYGARLAKAEECLTSAWDLEPSNARVAVAMMRVELGQGQGKQRMELWFDRAMKLAPNYYDACNLKLYYLEPKWYGSVAEMLAFGRQCVTNEQWGGHVPLVLMDAHKSIQRQYIEDAEKDKYWSRPEVWSDLKSAFTRFFELNPNDTGWYHDYAWYAYQAGDWQTFNDLVPKLGQVNYSFFGGKENFDQMVKTAKNRARQAGN